MKIYFKTEKAEIKDHLNIGFGWDIKIKISTHTIKGLAKAILYYLKIDKI